ncbi:MAG: hypothetical protein JSV56_03400, partial [Methanomassiliicoccales archaeon]
MDEVRLTNGSGDILDKDMAVWGNYVHVVWSDDRTGDYDIYYKKSNDYGFNWSDAITLYNSSIYDTCPNIAVFENHVHVVLSGGDGEIKYVNSSDNGETWSDIVNWDWTTYPPSGPDAMMWPDVAVDGNYVYIVGTSWGTSHVIFKRSLDNGTTWTDWIFVYEGDFPYPFPTIHITDNMIHITTDQTKSPLYERWVDHYYSDDFGDTWHNNTHNPIIFYFSDELIISHVTASIYEDKYCLYYSLMEIDGITNIGTFLKYCYDSDPETWYGPELVLSNGEGHFDVEKDHLVWGEEDADNYRQLHYNKTGQITDFPSNSVIPLIRVYGDIKHILWEDDRDGLSELYYTQTGLWADFVITPSDIIFNPPSPVENGTEIFINVTVHNYGTSSDNVKVIFYNGDPDTDDNLIPDPSAEEIGNDTIDISEYSSTMASTQWIPPSEGEYYIYIWVDPNNSIQEYNNGNNLANKTLEVVPGIFTQELEMGWNLISIPLEMSNNDLISVLQPIEGQYDSAQWYNSSDINDPWKHHHTSKAPNLNDFQSIDQHKGFWLHITEPGGTTLTIIDNKISTSQNITLNPGWNHVGYPSLSNKKRTAALNNLDFNEEVDFIQTYDAANQKWEEIGESDHFELGRGYWVHTTTECVWEVPL